MEDHRNCYPVSPWIWQTELRCNLTAIVIVTSNLPSSVPFKYSSLSIRAFEMLTIWFLDYKSEPKRRLCLPSWEEEKKQETDSLNKISR
jgi:hypothetical protein